MSIILSFLASAAQDEATDDDSLKALFDPFGNITSVVAMKANMSRLGFTCEDYAFAFPRLQLL